MNKVSILEKITISFPYNKGVTRKVNFFHVELSATWFMKYDMLASIIEGDLQLQNPSLKSIFKKLYLETYNNDTATKIAVDRLVFQVFSEIVRNNSYKKAQKPTWVFENKGDY